VLDHAGEGLIVLAGFWRFLFSGPYRTCKIEEWREWSTSWSGRLAVGVEILAGVMIGLGLPVALILAWRFWI
jgi:hypothetical protein